MPNQENNSPTKSTIHPKQDSNLRVPFGLKDGRMYEPRQVPPGKDCGCICPNCKGALNAKHALKNKVTPHFQHQPNENCNKGRESAIHLAAKQLIEEYGKLYLPIIEATIEVEDVTGCLHAPSAIIRNAGLTKLLNVRLEKSAGDFRPDLMAQDEDGYELLIEIAVKHFVDDEKLIKIERKQTALIEIDVSTISIFSFDQLEQLLFNPIDDSKFSWKYHPVIEQEEERLREQLMPKLNAIKDQYEADRIKASEEFKALNSTQKMEFCLERIGLTEYQIPPYLDYDVCFGDTFGVPRKIWQLAIYTEFIFNRANKEFSAPDVLDWMTKIFELNNEFTSHGWSAVNVFLNNLKNLGILNSAGKSSFYVQHGQDRLDGLIARKTFTRPSSGYIWEPLLD